MNYFRYGIDAPILVRNFFFATVAIIVCIIILAFVLPAGMIKNFILVSTSMGIISCMYPVIAIIIGSLFQKQCIADELLAHVNLPDNAVVLDVVCGRGLLMIKAAKQVNNGKVVGIDSWQSADQSGNTKEKTMQNIIAEQVGDNTEVITADMRTLPFPDAHFDAVISSWAIHNIDQPGERKKALQEIMRVLKPNGRIGIVDIQCYQEYVDFFNEHGCAQLKMVGPYYVFGLKNFIIVGSKVAC